MWSNDSFGGRGGGFVPSDGKSPATGDKQQTRVKRSQNIFPITIRQLLESQNDVIKIQDTEVSVITIVGLVKSVEHTSTKTSYLIDDQTGTIDAVTYVGTDDGDSKAVVLMENTYGRVTGSLRTTKGSASNSKYIITFKVSPVLDMNEVISHSLEVLQVPMKLKKLKEQQNQKVGLGTSNNAGSSLSNSMIGNNLGETSIGANVSSDSTLNGLTPTQAMVFRCIQSVKVEEGAHVQQIIANLKNKVSEKDVRAAVEFLSGEGNIYSTKDDEHYKCTDCKW